MLAAGEGISSKKSVGEISVFKVKKQSTDSWLSDFFNKRSDSYIQLNGIDQLFNDTDDILVQVRIEKVR